MHAILLTCKMRVSFFKLQLRNPSLDQRIQRCAISRSSSSTCLAETSPLMKSSSGFHIDQVSFMKLIENAVSNNGSESFSIIFSKFRDIVDCHLCTSMIRRYTDSKSYTLSVYFYLEMRKFGILPDSSTFPPILKAAAQLGDIALGRAIHGAITRMGFQFDVYINTALVHFYCTCFSMDEGCHLFDEMPERNSVSWNALITGYTHNNKFVEAIDLFREMLAARMEPSERTVVGVLTACAQLGALNQGKWIHEFIGHKRLRLNVFVGTALVDMYAKCGVVDEAEKVFHELREKNVYTWNALISGLAMNGQAEDAMWAFSRMLIENVKPDEITFIAVLCACCHQGLVTEGKKQFSQMKEQFGLQPRIEHYGCMVDLLGRAGNLEEAMEVIQTMNVIKPDPIIWRSLLFACRVHENTKLGEHVVKKLIELEPCNGENYILLSNLYSRSQRWVEVGNLREMMDRRVIRKVAGFSMIEIENVVYKFNASHDRKTEDQAVHKMLNEMIRKIKSAGYVVGTEMALYDLEEEEKEQSVMYHSEKLALAFGILNPPSDSMLRIVKNLRICQDCHEFFKAVSLVYEKEITVRDRKRFHHFSGGICSCRDYCQLGVWA